MADVIHIKLGDLLDGCPERSMIEDRIREEFQEQLGALVDMDKDNIELVIIA